jgi:hypothetical protein
MAGEWRALIRTMQAENFTWGVSRIHGELIKLGCNLLDVSISKYMKKHRKLPFQRWQGFLTGGS